MKQKKLIYIIIFQSFIYCTDYDKNFLLKDCSIKSNLNNDIYIVLIQVEHNNLVLTLGSSFVSSLKSNSLNNTINNIVDNAINNAVNNIVLN